MITATNFYNAWIDTCNEQKADIRAVWSEDASLTSRILYAPDSVLRSVGARLEHQCVFEYYSTDGVLYLTGDRVPNTPAGQTWLHRFRVAFEHEIRFGRKLAEEMSHLMLLDTDLRVLVTYSPERESTLEQYLAELHSLISLSDRAQRYDDERSILVIIGWINDAEGSLYWRAYSYTRNAWVVLGEQKL